MLHLKMTACISAKFLGVKLAITVIKRAHDQYNFYYHSTHVLFQALSLKAL